MKPYWTTAKGEQIPYSELSDDHLENIIKDGYWNPILEQEVCKRGIEVPARPVEELSVEDHMRYIESFNSCAISNKLAMKMSELYDNDRPTYFFELNKILQNEKSK